MKLNWNGIRSLVQNTKDVQQIALANIAGKIIAGIFWFYMAAVLGTENYGHVNYLIAIGSMGAAVSMVGTSNTIIVYAAKKIPIESTLYTIALIIGTIASIVLYFLFGNIIVCVFVFGYIVYNLGIGELLGKKFYKKYSIILVLQKILFVSFALLFYNFIGFEGVVLGFGLSMLAFLPVIINGYRETRIDFSILKPRFGFMMNNYGLTIEKILSGQLDKLIIAPMFGFVLLGNYALSIQFYSVMSMLPNIVFQYTLSRDASGKSNSTIKKISIGSSVLIAAAGITLSPIVIPIVFPEYVESIELVQILSIHVISNAIMLAYSSKFLGQEKSKYVLISQGISVIVYIGGLLTLGLLIGINGVAISLVLAGMGQAIFYIVSAQYLKNQELNKNKNKDEK